MLILLIILAAGIVLGRLRGGSLRRLGDAKLRMVQAVFAGVVLQGSAAFVGSRTAATVLALTSHVGVFAFAGANAKRPGMPLLALGALMNFVVVAANGSMPVSLDAMARAGIGSPAIGLPDLDALHEPLTDTTRLAFLADTIPVRVARHVVSPGDLVLWAGLLAAIQGLMIARSRSGAGAHAA
ncbi:MAG TPA: DUF5317 domain-containing protein [Actinomycetota bacterium]|nr:DUF5317 domain-containing protein [Actinomycetota bacterium]